MLTCRPLLTKVVWLERPPRHIPAVNDAIPRFGYDHPLAGYQRFYGVLFYSEFGCVGRQLHLFGVGWPRQCVRNAGYR